MSEWDVLNLDSDPTPGDPDVLRMMAGRLREQAGLADHNTHRLRAIAGSGGGDLRMAGDYAPLFTGALEELPGELSKLARAYQGCGDALATYAGLLADVKTQSGSALRQGVDAEVQYQGALRQVQALLPPERENLLLPRAELTDASITLATASWDDEAGKAQVRQAALRGRVAAADRDRARALALQAGKIHGAAAHTCAGAIKRALSSAGIKNKPWWEKAWNAVTGPFRSWNDFMSLARDVALVAGVVALFLTGPVGLAIMLVAIGAGALVFASTFDRYVRGETSLGELALNSLGLVPGGHGVVDVADLGRLGAALVRGEGGKLVTAGLREFGGTIVARSRAAVAFVLDGAGSARETLAEGYQFTKSAASRVLGRDPIDLASGQVILTQVDVELPGVLAWSLARTYMSSYRAGRWFGPAWSSTVDHRLEIDADGVCYVAPDGVLFAYPQVEPGCTALPADGPRLPLGREENGGYTIRDIATGLVLEFAAVPPDTGGRGIVLPLAGMVDRNGHRIDIGYDDDGGLASLRHSGGYRLGFETAAGRVVEVSMAGAAGEPPRTIARYGYDEAGGLVEVVNSSGQALRLDYHPDGRLARWTDRNGTGYAYTYDDAGRVVRTEGSDGYLNGTLAYDTDRHVTVQTDSLGHITAFHFNDRMQLERQVDQLGHVTTYSWDRYDRKLSDTDPLGRTVRYGYDAAGNLAEVIQPDGTRTTVEWNELRLPVTIVEPDGARWHRGYDSRGNLTTTVDPTGARTTARYDELGRPTAVTDALGHTRTIQTNDAGLPVAVADPLGGTTRFTRDSFGRVVTMTDPAGGVTGYTWTVEGNLASHTLPDGTTQRWTYDGEGNLTEHLDAAGLTTSTEIGHFDLTAAQTTPAGARLEYTYDTELRLIAVTNAQGLEWRYDYDPAGQLIRQTDFNGLTTTYAYDAAGQLTATTNDAGDTIHLTRDILGNIIEKRAGDDVTTFSYDTAGRMIRATNADSDCTFQRDALGRILAETRDGHTVTSTYDLLGRRIRRTTPAGSETVWDYDPNGLPQTLTTTGGVLRFTHDAAGRETQRRLDTGSVLTQVWDAAGRILSQTITSGSPETAGGTRLLQRRDYSYSPDGYLTDIDDLRTGITSYTLDEARRVTGVDGPRWQERYAYDPAGNITDAAWPGPSGPSDDPDTAAQGSREYTGTLIRRAGVVRYEHDRQGRITRRGLSSPARTWHYRWDADSRLTDAVTPDNQHWHYRYDPLGRRIAKEHRAEDGGSIETITFTWDGAVLAEQACDTGDATTVTTWNHEQGFRPLTHTEHSVRDSEQAGARFHAVITDSVGTPTDFVGPAGALGHHVHGNLWGATGTPMAARSDGDVDCPLRFPGQYHDPETGFYYNYQRHYDPATGRYASGDPLGLAPGPNPYTYVANPLEQFDPLGLAPCVQGGAGMARARTVTIAHPPEGMIGATDEHGNIFIKPGLTRKRYRQTLRHETVHSILTPPAPFNKITLGLYKYSLLYRWAEEGAAESYGTRNIAKGFVFPILNGYLIKGPLSAPRLAVETAAATAAVHEVYSWTQ